MSNSKQQEFSKLRSFFWPIHKEELAKFLPLGLMMFFILFNYSTLRTSKDALALSAGGGSIIPFLKGYVVFPASIIFVFIYSKMVASLSREKIFYYIISAFLIFYVAFGFFLYPNRDWLHPSPEYIANLKQAYPTLQHFISILGHWSYSLYYVLAELWGTSMLSLLFWQFANDITKTKEAKRFYAMFALIANIALILAGLMGKYYYQLSLQTPNDPYAQTAIYTATSLLISGLATIILYRWVNVSVLTKPRFYTADEKNKKPKKKKLKMSISEAFKFLLTSKYLGMIALLVICYGISINLIETLWKDQVTTLFKGDKNQIYNFMQNLAIGTGAFTMVIILFSKGVVQKFGWFNGAIVTPLVILITGALFFSFVFFSGYFEPVVAGYGMSVLLAAVWIGTIQNILSKGIKYGLFDPTKEMSYIPLDDNLKTRGKAAVDVIGSRLGKAGGGYISSGIMMIMAGGVMDIAPILSIFIIAVILIWIYAVTSLNKLYHDKLKETEIKS